MYNLRNRGFMFVLSSPSGAGKTTLSKLLLQSDSNITLSTSYTTRPMRPNEEDKKDYFFINKEDFQGKIDENFFFEYAEVFGSYYGTPKHFVEDNLESGKEVLFDIDWQGTRRLTERARDDVVSVFILPPSMEELERRLKARAQDSLEVIAKRMSRASHEISHWDEYDYIIVNNSLDESLIQLQNILKAERLKRKRQKSLTTFIAKLVN